MTFSKVSRWLLALWKQEAEGPREAVVLEPVRQLNEEAGLWREGHLGRAASRCVVMAVCG